MTYRDRKLSQCSVILSTPEHLVLRVSNFSFKKSLPLFRSDLVLIQKAPTIELLYFQRFSKLCGRSRNGTLSYNDITIIRACQRCDKTCIVSYKDLTNCSLYMFAVRFSLSTDSAASSASVLINLSCAFLNSAFRPTNEFGQYRR
jgi:hypothetical protein